MDEQPHPNTAASELYPQARHHTYLPGIITPLLLSSGDSNHISNSSSGTCFASQQPPPPPQGVHYNDAEHRPSWVQELAILELSADISSGNDDYDHTELNHSSNIVIFPGSIVPLRLLDHEWITYLQQQIRTTITSSTTNNTSCTPAAPVRFGILMPLPSNNSNHNNDDDPQNHHHFHSSIPEQRQSWTRQAHGPNTLRRLSDQLIQALGPNFDYDDVDDSSDNDSENDNDMDSRNLNSTMITEPEARRTTTTTNAGHEGHPQRLRNERDRVVSHRNDRVSWTLRRHRPQQSSNINDNDNRAPPIAAATTNINDTDMLGPLYSEENLHVRQDSRRSELRNRRRLYQLMLEERRDERNRRRRSSQSLSLSSRSSINNTVDRYIGRIGTIATVLYTHGNNDGHSNNNEHSASVSASSSSSSSSSSLVITAIGTSRFRIVGYRNEDERNEYKNAQNRHLYMMSRRRRHGDLKHFLIEELKDVPMNLPSHSHYCHLPMSYISETSVSSTEYPTETSLKYYKNHLLHLSNVSPYPKNILQKMWPWKIMADICEYIQTVAPTLLSGFLLPSTKDELVQQLQHKLVPDQKRQNDETDENSRNISVDERNIASDNEKVENGLDMLYRNMDPSAFSYWMATNLPFRYEEKIHQLEICSTIERLQYILDKLREDQLFTAMIHCKQCKSPLAFTYDMFTVNGADGTTGNYVNEYGHVHQTITLRSIDDNGVWYQGEPQSQDSWFPGYSWTIMACAVCGHHLGWKFTTNNSGSTNSHNLQRPSTFYGVSAANISTFVP